MEVNESNSKESESPGKLVQCPNPKCRTWVWKSHLTADGKKRFHCIEGRKAVSIGRGL